MFSANSPVLYTDNRDNIVDILMRIGSFTKRELADKNLDELKDLRDKIVKQHKDAVIHEQVAEIKSYALYSEIIDTFNEIISDEYYDAPLMFEYNTWRAMTMLDGGNIKGNLILTMPDNRFRQPLEICLILNVTMTIFLCLWKLPCNLVSVNMNLKANPLLAIMVS